MAVFGTRQVAVMLGMKSSRLTKAIWDNRIDAPPKGLGGVFLWSRRNVEQASWVLRGRSADDVLPPEPVEVNL